MATKKFYIGRRDNPQLPRPYFIAYNQLTKIEAKKKENCSYGSMSLTSYESIEEYNIEIEKLKKAGLKVSINP